MDKSRNQLVNVQIIVDVLFIIFLLISIYLLCHREHNRDGTNGIRLFNRVFLVIIYSIFLWVAYESYKRSKHEIDFLTYIAAIIAVIPPAILLYIFFLIDKEHNPNIENPCI